MNETNNRIHRFAVLKKIGTLLGVTACAFILDQTTEFSDENFSFHASHRSTPIQPRKPASNSAPRLLFITLDGVRREEFMDCKKLARHENFDTKNCSFPKLWEEVRNESFSAFAMEVGNQQNLSLPGYQSIYGGQAFDATCVDNTDCAQIPIETWLEELKRTFDLPAHSVASLASWSKMPIAVEKQPGTIFTNAGQIALVDPLLENSVPADLLAMNSRMLNDPPSLWENARRDVYTYQYARWYWNHIKPQVLAVGLLDSDEWGHLDHFDDYKKQLQTYDGYIAEWLKELRESDDLNDTIVMVTTDHGRGKGWFGKAFKGHGPGLFLHHSKKTWFAVSVPQSLKPRLEILWKELHMNRIQDQSLIRKLVLGLMTETPLRSSEK